jgi:hypothetical protein
MGGYNAISFNSISNTPEHMSRAGLGLDLCLYQVEYQVARNTILSLGLVDLQFDFRYLKKGYTFAYQLPDGVAPASSLSPDYPAYISHSEQDARAKAHMTDFAFMFPIGFTQRFSTRWSGSLYVTPGVGLVSFRNDWIEDGIHHKDHFHPTSHRAGFRLDVKALVWFEDMGLYLRYQPVGPRIQEKQQNLFSLGLAFRY